MPVIDETGVVGQVTRVYPWLAEVTLVTDKDQSVPVQVVRNGLRACAFGAGNDGALELRFMPRQRRHPERRPARHLGHRRHLSARPAGRQVANVERDAGQVFARIVCKPLAGVDRSRYVLVLAARRQRCRRAPEEARRARPAQRRARRAAQGGGRDDAAPDRHARSRREEILLPASAGVHRAHARSPSRCCSNLLPWPGWRAALRPISSRWCCSSGASTQPRHVGLGVAWLLGLLMDVARRDAVRPARARLRRCSSSPR